MAVTSVTNCQFATVIVWLLTATSATAVASSAVSRPNCTDRCGIVTIPYPFGIGPNCSLNEWFEISCHNNSNPILTRTNLQILNLSVSDNGSSANTGQWALIRNPISFFNCTNKTNRAPANLTATPFYYTSSNEFLAVSCGNRAKIATRTGNRFYGCTSIASAACFSSTTPKLSSYNNGFRSCDGNECCTTSAFASSIGDRFEITMDNISEIGGCKYAFLMDSSSLGGNETMFRDDQEYVPVQISWRLNSTLPEIFNSSGYDVRNMTMMMMNNSFYCKNESDSSSGKIYICHCKHGYKGNPYLKDGCQDINECEEENPPKCHHGSSCSNTIGGYVCKDRNTGAIVGLAVALGVVCQVGGAWGAYNLINTLKDVRFRNTNFIRHGGSLFENYYSGSEATNPLMDSINVDEASTNVEDSQAEQADEADNLANQANDQANTADNQANQADDRAEKADDRANQDNDRANKADNQANQAEDRANEANDRANKAGDRADKADANQANDQAKKADNQANQADDRADKAGDRANQAKDRANKADNQANQANDRANKADNQANKVDDRANQAKERANQADDRAQVNKAGNRGNKGDDNKVKLFSLKELKKITDNFSSYRSIGEGDQSNVYKGMLEDGTVVAVKKFKKRDEAEALEFINELDILWKINHPNIVKFLGCCLESDVPFVVYEFLPNLTLAHHIQHDTELAFTSKMRLLVAIDVATALSYLHSADPKPIYHRVVNSSNILLDEKHRAKLANLRISNPTDESDQFIAKSEVYSFGVVLAEVLTGEKVITSEKEEAKLVSLMKEKGVDGDVVKIAESCLQSSVGDRPTMKDVEKELRKIVAKDSDFKGVRPNHQVLKYRPLEHVGVVVEVFKPISGLVCDTCIS